jgi:hypothetical protein
VSFFLFLLLKEVFRFFVLKKMAARGAAALAPHLDAQIKTLVAAIAKAPMHIVKNWANQYLPIKTAIVAAAGGKSLSALKRAELDNAVDKALRDNPALIGLFSDMWFGREVPRELSPGQVRKKMSLSKPALGEEEPEEKAEREARAEAVLKAKHEAQGVAPDVRFVVAEALIAEDRALFNLWQSYLTTSSRVLGVRSAWSSFLVQTF